MIRCTQCILPETYPDIAFDSAGICHKCHEQRARYLNRDLAACERELARIVDWAKSKKKEFDCIVPFSGGKDSAYTLWLCRKKYGMKVLAANYNNGLRTTQALVNIETITHRADVALASYGPSWETMRELYRAFFLATGLFCFPCDMGIWGYVNRCADVFEIPLIVSGFSAQMESRGPQIYSYNNNLFRRIAGQILSPKALSLFLSLSLPRRIALRLKRGRITRVNRQISLPDYMVWDDREIKRTIHTELGWQPHPDGTSDHIDCKLAPMKNYLVVQKWGFGEKTTKYAAMVRAGQMNRDEAIEKAAQEDSLTGREEQLEGFCETLQVTPADVRAAASKSHLPYLV